MHSHSGELAALGTALCWSFGSVFFTISSRIFGHMVVNRIRLALAFCLLVIVHLVFVGRFLPVNMQGYHLFWFGLSGIIGFAIGDSLLFKSFVLIGPRLAMLTMSLAPVFGVIIAWLFLHEVLNIADIAAIVVTLAGICWVLLGQRNGNQVKNTYMNGILYGVGGALGQAIGLILSKKGLANNFPALDGNIIRLFAATSPLWA